MVISVLLIFGDVDSWRCIVIDWPNLVLGTVIGFLLSIAVEWWFGLSASKELRLVADGLKRESRELRHQNEITLSALASAGMFNPKRDETGRIIGGIHTLSGTSVVPASTGSGPGLTSSPPADAKQ
jgi:hypothetical protein